ncbi:MAG: 4Fe-4S binding protein [Alphaproteobacteria bacterium]
MQTVWRQPKQHHPVRALRHLLSALLLLPVALNVALAATAHDDWHAVFPDATDFGEMADTPPAAPAFRNGELIGYVASTRQAIDAKGYAGGPIDILLGIDLDARLVGARLIEQHEPILKTGVRPDDLEAFVSGFAGLDLNATHRVVRAAGAPGEIDAISGATISSVVIGDVILRTARAVASSRGLFGETTGSVAFEEDAPATWAELVEEGSIRHLAVTVRQASDAIGALGADLYPPGAAPPGDAPFIDVFAGLATPVRVGKNLLGERLYNRLMNEIEASGQLLFVAASGAYSFKGTSYVRDGAFDRFRLLQGTRSIAFEKDDHVSIEKLALNDAPELREIAIFKLAPGDGLQVTEPWTLDLQVKPIGKTDGPPASFMLPYDLPERFLATPAEPEPPTIPLWQEVWRSRAVDIGVLIAALTLLTGILVFQDAIAARPKLYRALRFGFLIFVLLWLGWYASAQLSVLNVLTFAKALLTKFDWGFFLLEPLIFILWGYVAVALLFWGRGVFCGWLCPFGALQELSHHLAKRLRLPELRLPFALHERLWPIKFVIFLGLFALSLGPMASALRLAEVEPFKTAVVLRFDRAWPFVAYALALLAAGLFIERFFCRYLCPLGAAFAIPSRLRQFEWLKRRWQCGRQCRICAVGCPVQAIHPEGQINPSECIYCLACQVNYQDDHICPPLIERRKRREKRDGTIANARLIDVNSND